MRLTDAAPRRVAIIAFAIATSILTGCVSVPAPTYQPSIRNTERLISAPIAPVALGRFDASPGVDRPLNVRGSHLQGGADGSFASYIRDALAAELSTAGRLEAAAGTRISGTLLDNDLSAAAAGGRARIRMRFSVERDGTQHYERELAVEHAWDSSFMGAIAIPAAMNNYAGAVQVLIGKLLDDPEFQRVVAERR
ncbi:MAG TPA: hypothetical protein VFE72_02115 [Lysobacter sp.]|nr:hypothetical protein [Lysobacter sp.]